MPRTRAGTKNDIYTIKDFQCSDGVKLDINIAYRTFGNKDKPAVLLPTCFGGVIDSTLGLLKPGKVLDPANDQYYVIVVAMLGNGESSSPSNTPAPHDRLNFPKTKYVDNIRAQYRLVTDCLGLSSLHAVIGFSMGCQQMYHWVTLYPDFVKFGVGLAGSAKTSWHNYCFLEGPKNALLCSADYHDGAYTDRPVKGLKAFGRAYSAWALSAAWFREEKWRAAGHESLEAYLKADWDDFGFDACDLLCLVHTWQSGNIADYTGGDYIKALQSIKAPLLIMPCRTDQYFPPEDSEFEVAHLKSGTLKVIESIGGHIAGGCASEPEASFISDSIRDLFHHSSHML